MATQTPQIEKPTAPDQFVRWAAKLVGLLNAWWQLGTNRIQTVPVPAPGPTNDLEVLQYNATSGAFQYAAADSISGTVVFVDNETPGGTINGTTAVFTLAAAPNPPASLVLVKTRAVMLYGADYVLSGSTITYAAPQIPIASPLDWHRASYRT